MIPAWVNGALQPVDKLEVHRLGLRHPAVSVILMRGDQTLLQRRAAGKYHSPGLWANACCTHPHWGEDPAACAARRLGQELGITGLDLRPLTRTEYRAPVAPDMTEHELVDIFLAEAPEGLPIAPDPAEVWQTRWASLPGLRAEVAVHPDRFTPWLRIYLAAGWAAAPPSQGV